MSDPLENMAERQERERPLAKDAAPPAPPTDAQIRARQLGRARVMAWLLAAFVILMFAISIARIRSGH